MKNPQISVVIPSYNRRDCVLALLSDLQKQEDVEYEIIVVDDCSPDDSVDAIREKFPEVRLLENEKNQGPAFSRNQGIRAAKGDYIAGFDSDVTLPDPLILKNVIQTFADNPGAAGLAFRLFEPDGKTDDAPRWWHSRPIGENSEKTFETDYFSGTAYAFHTETLHQAGLFPEWLYMHYEEVVLAWRILDTNNKLLYSPSLTAIHHANPVSRRSEIEVFYKPRNQILIAIDALPILAALNYGVPRVSYQFLKALRDRHLVDFTRAMKSTLVHLPACLKSRNPLSYSTLAYRKQLRSKIKTV